jgi:hypothetical protein
MGGGGMNESLILHPRYKALFEGLLKDNILSYSDIGYIVMALWSYFNNEKGIELTNTQYIIFCLVKDDVWKETNNGGQNEL